MDGIFTPSSDEGQAKVSSILDAARQRRSREAHAAGKSSLWTVTDMLRNAIDEIESGKIKANKAMLFVEDTEQMISEHYANIKTDDVILTCEIMKHKALTS